VSRCGPFGTVLKAGELSNFSIGGSRVRPISESQEYCKPSSNNNWDYFLLVREWPGTMTPGPLPTFVDTFTLHGLWPNRNDGSWPQCCNNSYPFSYNQIAPIINDVERVWYDTMHDQQNATSFWGHEWDKHGTCWAAASGGNELKYFQMCVQLHDAMTLAEWLAAANIVPADPSQTLYSRSAFVSAISASLGATPLLKCTYLNGNTVIQNVGVCVSPSGSVMECPANQVATWAKDENCGDNFGLPTIPH
jgi:ribonuclease T2